jgi:probable F420-dependent oxidoreductase
MKLGIAALPIDTAIRPDALAVAVEERGFESLWFGDHSHIPASRETPWPGGAELPEVYYRILAPVVALTSAAAVTTTLRLGTGVLLVAQRDPIHVAKELATLDLLSGGRVLFGVGSGWNVEEMRDHGTDPRTRGRLLEERVEAIRMIWTTERASYHGDFVEFDDMFSWPKPVQQPHPPVHVGGAFPVGLERALRIGDGWIPMSNRGDGDFAGHLARLPELAEKAGRSPQGFEVTIYGAPRDSDALLGLASLGVDRAVFVVGAADEPRTLAYLDTLAELADKLG